MPRDTKDKRAWFYISEEHEKLLESLTCNTRLTNATALTLIVSAGLEACALAGHRLPLPLKFELVEASPALNESAPAYRVNKPKK